jgi:hypothetical protein
VICYSCRLAGDVDAKSKELTGRPARDEYNRSRGLHLHCTGKGCFCQHRVGAKFQK